MFLSLTEHGFKILDHDKELYIDGSNMYLEKNYLLLLLSMIESKDSKLELTLLKDQVAYSIIEYFAIRLDIVERITWGKYGKAYTLKHLLDKINKKII